MASEQGWDGVLTSERLVGTCTIFVGTVVLPTESARALGTARDNRVGREGEAVCDRQPGEGPPPAAAR